MEQSNPLEEIDVSITWNPESNCTCRKKNHFLFRWSTSTLPEQHIRHLMYCWEKTHWWSLERGWRKRIVWWEDWRGNKQPQDPTMYGQICGCICLMQQKRKQNKNGPSRNQNSIMPKDYVVSSSVNLRMKNSDTSSKMLVESWRFRCQQQCLVEFNIKCTGKPVAQLDNTRRNMLVLLRPTNLWGYAWKGLKTRTMKTASQEEAWIHWVATIWCTSLFQCLKHWKIPDAKAAVEKEWEKLEKILAWQLAKVRNKKEVIEEARNKGRQRSLRVIDGSLSSREFGVGASISKVQKQSRTPWMTLWLMLQDHTQYSVNNVSSASQMTAAKVMDTISKLPGCAGQAADAVSSYTQVKMEDAPTLLKIPKSECPDIWIRLPKHKWPKKHGPVWKTQLFLFSGICTVILWQDYCGNGNVRKFYWNTVGKKVPNWECLFVKREKGRFLSVYVDDIKLAGKKQNK